MPKETAIIAGVLSVLVALLFLGLSSCGKKHELLQTRQDLEEAQALAATNSALVAELRAQLAGAESRIKELQDEQAAAAQLQGSLEQEMRAALESKDVTISNLQGRLTVNIVDRVMFESGQAEVKPEGEGVLKKVAALMAQRPTLEIQVIGHTDNVPISPAARSRFPSNWELSAARAIAAVRYLTEHAGVQAGRVGAVGHGEFRPLADNSTAEGRAKNRRIEIQVVPDQPLPPAAHQPHEATPNLPLPPPPGDKSDSGSPVRSSPLDAPR